MEDTKSTKETKNTKKVGKKREASDKDLLTFVLDTDVFTLFFAFISFVSFVLFVSFVSFFLGRQGDYPRFHVSPGLA